MLIIALARYCFKEAKLYYKNTVGSSISQITYNPAMKHEGIID